VTLGFGLRPQPNLTVPNGKIIAWLQAVICYTYMGISHDKEGLTDYIYIFFYSINQLVQASRVPLKN
jgi:hypothetical protein